MSSRCILLAGVAALAGCAAKDRYREPRNVLERAIGFREIDRHGTPNPLGRDEQDPSRVVEVPSPATVDIESVIEIGIDKAKLHEAGGTAVDAGDLRDLKERADRLRKTAESALEVMKEQQQLLREFRDLDSEPADSPNVRAFVARVEAADRKEAQVIAVIVGEYDRATQDRIDTRMRGRRGLLAISEFLQEEVVVLERRQREVSDRLEAAQLSLRLSAYLDSPGREPVKIRLPGYDSLPDGHIVPVARNGLPLTAEDQQALQQAWQSTIALSTAMQRFADGEAEVRELLLATAPVLSKRLGEWLLAVEQLVADVKAPAFAADLDRVKSQLPALLARLRAVAGDALRDELAELTEQLDMVRADQGQLAAVLGAQELLGLLERGKALAERWRNARSTDLGALGLDSLALANELAAEIAKFDKVKALASLEDMLTKASASATADLSTKLKAVPAEFPELRQSFDRLVSVALRAKEVTKRLVEQLSSKKTAAQPVAHPPESFEVPVEDATATAIDLLQVPRRDGDVVRLRATVSRGGKVLHEGEAGFRIESFGWRGKLSPSVVLARPAEIPGDELFQFAPVLSWLHGYNPRPDEGGWYHGVNRFFQPAFGIHAGFLNFDPDEEIEIGLGATLSFWEGRLQVGAGANLMAENDDQGRYYWFVGSDLISLLQTVGLVEP